MKTSPQIKKEIASIKIEFADERFFETAELKRAGKRVTLLRQYLSYLQAGAQEKFLKKDLEVLETRLDLIDKGFGKWLNYKENDQLKNPQAKYNSEMGTRKIKRQIEALKYLLN